MTAIDATISANSKSPAIKTAHVYPPIPLRNFDWCAWYADEDEEDRAHGYGATEQEAITDLIENWPREEEEAVVCSVVHEDDAPTCDAPWWLTAE